MKSTSGALIYVAHDVAVKVGENEIGDRVGLQGRWLKRHSSLPVPDVLQTWDRGYVMERLEPIDWATVNWHELLKMHIEALREIWDRPAEVECDVDRHIDYICELGGWLLPPFRGFMRPWCEDVLCHALSGKLRDLPYTLTHGDPTFDNLMRVPGTDRLSITDPLPARAEVPSYRAVDIAKICQSLHGYEHVKYGHPLPQVRPAELRELIGDVDDEEWEAVKYFTAAHFLRLLRYETNLQPVFADMFFQLLEPNPDWS